MRFVLILRTTTISIAACEASKNAVKVVNLSKVSLGMSKADVKEALRA